MYSTTFDLKLLEMFAEVQSEIASGNFMYHIDESDNSLCLDPTEVINFYFHKEDICITNIFVDTSTRFTLTLEKSIAVYGEDNVTYFLQTSTNFLNKYNINKDYLQDILLNEDVPKLRNLITNLKDFTTNII